MGLRYRVLRCLHHRSQRVHIACDVDCLFVAKHFKLLVLLFPLLLLSRDDLVVIVQTALMLFMLLLLLFLPLLLLLLRTLLYADIVLELVAHLPQTPLTFLVLASLLARSPVLGN